MRCLELHSSARALVYTHNYPSNAEQHEQPELQRAMASSETNTKRGKTSVFAEPMRMERTQSASNLRRSSSLKRSQTRDYAPPQSKKPRRSSSDDRGRSVSFEMSDAQAIERSVSAGPGAAVPLERRRRRLSSITFATPHVLAPWLAMEEEVSQDGTLGNAGGDKPRLSEHISRRNSFMGGMVTSRSFDFLSEAPLDEFLAADAAARQRGESFGMAPGIQNSMVVVPAQNSIVSSPSTAAFALHRANSAPAAVGVAVNAVNSSKALGGPSTVVLMASPGGSTFAAPAEHTADPSPTDFLTEQVNQSHVDSSREDGAVTTDVREPSFDRVDDLHDEEAERILREAQEDLEAQQAFAAAAAAAAAKKKAARPESSPSFDYDIDRLTEKSPFDDWYLSGRYEPERLIGKGSYGQVVEALDLWSNEKVAIKRIKGLFDNLGDARRILREISILREVRHKNIIQIRDIIRPADMQNFNELYVVFACRDTDMMKLIQDTTQTLSDQHVMFFMAQLLRGLQYMHNCRVLHRDLKPANILLTEKCELSICDFGLARGMMDDDYVSVGSDNASAANINSVLPPRRYRRQLTQHVATRWYRAPELILRCPYDAAIDAWSAGCIMAEMLTMMGPGSREALFPGGPCEFSPSGNIPTEDRLDQLDTIIDVLGPPPQETIDAMAGGPVDGLRTSLQDKLRKRLMKLKGRKQKMTLAERFKEAPPQAIDLLTKLLQFNPANRITIDEAIKHPFLAAYANEYNEQAQVGKRADFSFEKTATTIKNIRKFITDEIIWYENVWKEQMSMGETDSSVASEDGE